MWTAGSYICMTLRGWQSQEFKVYLQVKPRQAFCRFHCICPRWSPPFIQLCYSAYPCHHIHVILYVEQETASKTDLWNCLLESSTGLGGHIQPSLRMMRKPPSFSTMTSTVSLFPCHLIDEFHQFYDYKAIEGFQSSLWRASHQTTRHATFGINKFNISNLDLHCDMLYRISDFVVTQFYLPVL